MARETDGELVCNLGFDCPSESHYKDNLAGIKLSFLRRSQWLLSPSDFLRNWKADQYGICGQLCWQNSLSQVAPKASANLGQLDSPTPQQCRGQPHPLSR
jgi:hypothetical protein